MVETFLNSPEKVYGRNSQDSDVSEPERYLSTVVLSPEAPKSLVRLYRTETEERHWSPTLHDQRR